MLTPGGSEECSRVTVDDRLCGKRGSNHMKAGLLALQSALPSYSQFCLNPALCGPGAPSILPSEEAFLQEMQDL
jgi:hypothetical protein